MRLLHDIKNNEIYIYIYIDEQNTISEKNFALSVGLTKGITSTDSETVHIPAPIFLTLYACEKQHARLYSGSMMFVASTPILVVIDRLWPTQTNRKTRARGICEPYKWKTRSLAPAPSGNMNMTSLFIFSLRAHNFSIANSGNDVCKPANIHCESHCASNRA